MDTILLVLTLCSPTTHDCDAWVMDSFTNVTDCEEVIIASAQQGAFPLRCEVE